MLKVSPFFRVLLFWGKMVNCSVLGCGSQQGKVKGVTFHKFPKNEELRRKWTIAVRRENWTPSAHSHVCSKHFPEADMDRTSLSCVRLRENVVPSVLIKSLPPHLQKKKKVSRIPKTLHPAPSPLPLTTASPPPPPPPQSSRGVAAAVSAKELINTAAKAAAAAAVQVNLETPRETYWRSKLKESSDQLHCTRKKVRVLQDKVRRLTKRNASLLALNSELRSRKSRRLQEEEEEERRTNNRLSGAGAELLKRQRKNSSNSLSRSQYSPELRAFARTLRSYSPRAYEYVRNVFGTCLPHPRTLQRWHEGRDGAEATRTPLPALTSQGSMMGEFGIHFAAAAAASEDAAEEEAAAAAGNAAEESLCTATASDGLNGRN